jgi:hypothetical protein
MSKRQIIDLDLISSISDNDLFLVRDIVAGTDKKATGTKLLSYFGLTFITKEDYDANSLLVANTDNSPTALVVAASRIVGRKSTGDISALTPSEVRTIINVEDGADVTDSTNVNASGAVMESDYDANTILAANSDNIPAALTIVEQTLVGRITSGNIAALTVTQVKSMLGITNNVLNQSDYLDDIQTTINAASDGDIILLNKGTTNLGSTYITVNKRLTFIGHGSDSEGTIITSSYVSDTGPIFALTSAATGTDPNNRLNFIGMSFEGASIVNFGFRFSAATINHVSLIDVKMGNFAQHGIFNDVSDTIDWILDKCYFYENGGDHIKLGGTWKGVKIYNTIFDTSGNVGLYLSTGYVQDFLMQNCVVRNSENLGIYFYDDCNNVRIYDTLISQNGTGSESEACGIKISSHTGKPVYNFIIKGCIFDRNGTGSSTFDDGHSGTGFIIKASGVGSYVSDILVEDCKFIRNKHAAIRGYAKSSAVMSDNIVFKNNEFINNGYGVHTLYAATPAATMDAQYNFWGSDDGPGDQGPGSGDKVTGGVTYTNFLQSLSPPHNALTGLQGGTSEEYYHLTASEYTAAQDAVTKSTFDANSILIANTDNSPTALVVDASRIVGRKSTGGVVALTPSEVLAELSSQATTSFSFNSQKITNLANPQNSYDAVTKYYADSIATGFDLKASCRAATTEELNAIFVHNGTDNNGVGDTLTNAGVQTALVIDDVILSVNDRVLVKDQITKVSEVSSVDTIADVSGNLGGKYFLISAYAIESSIHFVDYYVWFDVDDSSVDPEVVDRTGVEIDISEDDNEDTIALAIQTGLEAINAEAVFDVSIANGNELTITHVIGGAVSHVTAGDSGFTVATDVIGSSKEKSNGIYIVNSIGSDITNWVLTRATDADNSPDGEVSSGNSTFIEEGTINAHATWVQVTTGTINLGDLTDPLASNLNWQISSTGSSLIAGEGLQIAGDTISIDYDQITLDELSPPLGDVDFNDQEATDFVIQNVANQTALDALTPVLGKLAFKVDTLELYLCTSV